MATTKRATKKPVTTTKKAIEDVIADKLEAAGYTNVEVKYDEEMQDHEDHSTITVEIHANNVELNNINFELECSIKRLPYCCGVLEIGDFSVSCNNLDSDDEMSIESIIEEEFSGYITEDNLMVLISKSFKKCLGYGERLLITTVVDGDNISSIFENAFEKTGLFEEVRRFTNPETGSELITYMSL